MQRQLNPIQQHLYEIIFGTETKSGKLFDLALIATILASVFVVLLDSFQYVNLEYGELLLKIEIAFTLVFTLEYFVRLYCSPNPRSYAFSFFGIIDLISILPTYIALIIPGISSLVVIRLLRIVRIFRILRLIKYLGEANILLRSLWQSRRKIIVFFFILQVLAIIYGCLMYVVEGPHHGFTNIPQSIYWAIVTITTVGYGDITPHTTLGQVLATFVMVTGYSIIAVPTGIFTAELAIEINRNRDNRRCANCNHSGHDGNAQYCKHCGTNL
ncbi:ion transporter [Halieaceae bacterium]|nr:ion transporter [Halieaceae bacterium]